MRYLLFLLLLWPVTGWAEEPLPSAKTQLQWQHIPDGGIRLREQIVCLGPECKLPPDCLVTMEAAMKAMDGHVAVAYLRSIGKAIPEYTPKGQRDMESAYAQWNEAKRCWKEHP